MRFVIAIIALINTLATAQQVPFRKTPLTLRGHSMRNLIMHETAVDTLPSELKEPLIFLRYGVSGGMRGHQLLKYSPGKFFRLVLETVGDTEDAAYIALRQKNPVKLECAVSYPNRPVSRLTLTKGLEMVIKDPVHEKDASLVRVLLAAGTHPFLERKRIISSTYGWVTSEHVESYIVPAADCAKHKPEVQKVIQEYTQAARL